MEKTKEREALETGFPLLNITFYPVLMTMIVMMKSKELFAASSTK